MLASDPFLSQSLSPAGEWEPFLSPPLTRPLPYFPCGRLHEVPQYLYLTALWEEEPPPPSQLPIFLDVFLYREMIRRFVPTAELALWLTSAGPLLEFLMAHWKSPLSSAFPVPSGDDSPLGLWNTRWYLFYGNETGLLPLQRLDPPLKQFGADYSLQSVDSGGSPPDGLDSGLVMSGWTLVLLHKYFTLGDFGPIVNYVAHGAWTLEQPAPPEPLSIFDPKVTTRWHMFFNNLGFPPNLITLTPWQP